MNPNKYNKVIIATGSAIVIGAMISLLASCQNKLRRQPLSTVDQVDLKKYVGTWHEIARLPNRFQNEECKAIAEYRALPDGNIRVINRQLCPDGSNKEIKGKATPVEGSGNARLRVKFEGWASLAPMPAEGNYWIIQLAEDYSVSLVGTPDRQYLWLLARDPSLDEKTINRYLDRAKLLGFDTSKLIYSGK